MAQLARRDLIGDLDDFCREVGLERLHELLDRDYNTERHEELVLTRESDEASFSGPTELKLFGDIELLKEKFCISSPRGMLEAKNVYLRHG